jgi:hypothetical protein
VDIVQQFTAQLSAAERDLPGPELLPERLARACAAVLPIDGAGLSAFFSEDRRLPLGASDPTSATAERLQFTVGEGPCLSAHSTGEPVFADERDMQARWPGFSDLLLTHSPVRGVISLPLHGALQDVGALDLYVHEHRDIRSVGLADTFAVLAVLTDTFARAMADEPRSDSGPAWLDAPAAGRRSMVWQAIGMVDVGLDIRGPDALALLRAYAFGHDTDLDAVAGDLVERRLDLAELSESAGTPP